MSSSILIAISLFLFALGYRYYSKFVEKKVYNVIFDKKTPAHILRDDIDYMPTKKHILFGHHFTSIAGAAPIVGPCIAAYWGWLPALLWVVLGTIFIGAVHDFGALVISLKERGRSIADIASDVMGEKATLMFLLFVMMLTWLVLAVWHYDCYPHWRRRYARGYSFVELLLWPSSLCCRFCVKQQPADRSRLLGGRIRHHPDQHHV